MELTVFNALWNVLVFFLPLVFLLTTCVAALFFRKWLSAAGLFVGMVAFFVYLNFGFSKHLSDADLTVSSFSVRSSNENSGNAIKALLAMDNDIVAFQEVSDASKKLLMGKLENTRYIVHEETGKSTLLFSKYPIKDRSYIGNIQRTLIDFKEGVVIYNIHAPKYTSNLDYHNDFFLALKESVKKEKNITAIIVLGDFNSVSNNYWRSTIEFDLGFKGALTHGGVGFLNTFPSKHRRYGMLMAFLSIDEIYIKGARSTSGEVHDRHYGSDHYPVLSRVSFD